VARLTLAEFLQQDASREWEWGEHDCGLRLADWYMAATGEPDPAAHLRGAYANEGQCEARFGGTLKQIRAVISGLGLPRTKEPSAGDIAVIAIAAAGERLVLGAIKLKSGWSVPGTIGLTRLADESVRIIAAWRIPQCRS
jgi:hypothetical protein